MAKAQNGLLPVASRAAPPDTIDDRSARGLDRAGGVAMRRTAHSILLVAMVFLASATQQAVAGQDSKLTVEAVGDVLHPGAYPLTPGLTALELLTLAGGSPSDTVHSLIVRRNRKARGGHDTIQFDPNERLRANDTLIVQGVYVLRPDEVLQIDVEGHPRLSGRYIVQDDKSVILPTGERLIVGNDAEFRLHIAHPELEATRVSKG
jgi:hypothetical protein